MKPMTLFEKVWDNHVIAADESCPTVIYIDLHLVHEVTSPQAFKGIRNRGLRVRRPERTLATTDHIVPTRGQKLPLSDPLAAQLVHQLEFNCAEFGITLYGLGDEHQGIIHVIGPELGWTQPGLTIVCGDSHTSTHGAFGALAFGIGSSEVEHVFATQCLLQQRPGTFAIHVDGTLRLGVTAKDIILAIIAQIGVDGGTGHVLEYQGSTIRSLNMEERMTICNMSIEGGARAGMVAPDDVTYQYLSNTPFAPKGQAWEDALRRWRQLHSDDQARFDQTLHINANRLQPMITFGTNPGMGIPVTDRIPDPEKITNLSQRNALVKALDYMGFKPAEAILGKKLDAVFIGSCTNSRISDLRAAAQVFKGRRTHPRVRTYIVPGSQAVRAAAEAEGLDKIFMESGAQWREPGCSMCIAMNGDELMPAEYCVSTSNRNFEGRQGKGGRTLLASPLTAAASAIEGAVADVRKLHG
jgi:3-isopropylmalate/(R)-2-methylmalate dehydratase large subunit